MRAPFRSSRPLVTRLALAAVLAAASPALAQPTFAPAHPTPANPTPADSTSAESAVATRGPTLDGARAGVSTPRRADRSTDAAAAAGSGAVSQPVALMIVGGVGVAVGLIVGGTGGNLLAFGSGVVGLVGLFQYLR